MLKAHESIKFSILDIMFPKNVSFVFFLDAIFCGINFFSIFPDIVWLVKSSCSDPCCSIHQFYWVSDCC